MSMSAPDIHLNTHKQTYKLHIKDIHTITQMKN